MLRENLLFFSIFFSITNVFYSLEVSPGRLIVAMRPGTGFMRSVAQPHTHAFESTVLGYRFHMRWK